MLANPLNAFSLAGRRAALTGAGSGIGREAALIFAAAGAHVTICDCNADSLRDTANLLRQDSREFETAVIDVCDREAVNRFAGQVSDRGPIDVWANLAGVISSSPVTDMDPIELDRIIDVNLKGTYWGCAAAARIMTSQGSGSIINISSGGADAPAEGLSAYSLTKAAVNMLTRTLALEVAAQGVRVNAIAPGFIDTPMIEYRYRGPDGSVDLSRKQALLELRKSAIPMGRVGVPRDIALTMLYLASDAAGFVTGQVIRPNGGQFMP